MGENLTTRRRRRDERGDRRALARRDGRCSRSRRQRVPCFKLGIKMGDGRFPIRFAAAGRPGAYLRIIEHGELGAGDVVDVTDVPDHDVTVALVAHAFHDDPTLAAKLLTAPALGAGWPDWARRQLAA